MPRQVRIEYEGALYHVMAREATVWKTLAENTGLEARGGTFREVAEAGLSCLRDRQTTLDPAPKTPDLPTNPPPPPSFLSRHH